MKLEDVKYFIGIDVAKDNLAVFFSETNKYIEIPNDENSLKEYFKDIKKRESLVVLETTGGYEDICINWLYMNGFKIFRVNTKKFKYFKSGLGKNAKTDKIDAKMLATYGKHMLIDDSVFLWKPKPKENEKLRQTLRYLNELIKTRAAEKTKLKSPGLGLMKDAIEETIAFLDEKIKKLTEQIESEINSSEDFKKKLKILTQYKGIGEKTATELILNLPELGKIPHQRIACLAGVAPVANDSGKSEGRRSTKKCGVRAEVKKAMYIAALSAKKYNEQIKTFNDRLMARGKRKMVAIIACMRKMLKHLNAIMRKFYEEEAAVKNNLRVAKIA